MTERINIGDSFYKDVDVTYIEDGEEFPVDLSIYDDNYVAIKRSRDTLDTDAFLLKRIFVKGNPLDGILSLDLSPEETMILPQVGDEMPYVEGFVQIGSRETFVKALRENRRSLARFGERDRLAFDDP